MKKPNNQPANPLDLSTILLRSDHDTDKIVSQWKPATAKDPKRWKPKKEVSVKEAVETGMIDVLAGTVAAQGGWLSSCNSWNGAFVGPSSRRRLMPTGCNWRFIDTDMFHEVAATSNYRIYASKETSSMRLKDDARDDARRPQLTQGPRWNHHCAEEPNECLTGLLASLVRCVQSIPWRLRKYYRIKVCLGRVV
eukprot:GHVU01146154.1.p1 GENE.GHVU01146154.1~~GHVU01146154.1.p1  ORF type:complete len:194 (+),score=13.25 GHVU01146154.1:1277-1858(+)